MENNSRMILKIGNVEFKAEGGAFQIDRWLKTVLDAASPSTITIRDCPPGPKEWRHCHEDRPAVPSWLPDSMRWPPETLYRIPFIDHDVVAIYDDAGIPSFMHRFRKTTNRELFGGSGKTHSAFIIGGEEYDEIYISVFENCNINGKPYSLPMQKPWTNITNDEAAKACTSKGEGWHLMTRPEWGLLANLCAKAGVFPHGNTNCGKYHADENEKGVPYDSYRTLTGSGPASWTHNHKPTGVHDLTGNIWEEVRALRIKDGVLQRAKDNDGAMDIDLSEESENWVDVLADNGKPVRVSVDHEEIVFTTGEDISRGYEGAKWKNVKIECESEQLKELGLYPGEPEAYCYIDSTDGEYLPICGGDWNSGASAGVFSVN